MLPILLEAYAKAKENSLLENELNYTQEQALIKLPQDMSEVIYGLKMIMH